MLGEVATKLKKNLISFNKRLQDRYQGEVDFDKQDLRARLHSEVGKLTLLERLSNQRLQDWLAQEVVVGVDGSLNKVGVNFPHYLYLLQALAKSTTQEDILAAEVFCPLLAEVEAEIEQFRVQQQQEGKRYSQQEAATKLRTSLLAKLELQVAIQAIQKWPVKLIMMDGSLIRYRIEAKDSWQQLRELALEKGVLLVGVIEEIATKELGARLSSDLEGVYDRELLFGALEVGEMLELEFKLGLKTAFLRPSQDPQVIGLDILKEQQDKLKIMADLIQTLTPKSGRGIPLWLDIVDNEVRISNQMVESLVDSYLDPQLKRRLFASKRQERIY